MLQGSHTNCIAHYAMTKLRFCFDVLTTSYVPTSLKYFFALDCRNYILTLMKLNRSLVL